MDEQFLTRDAQHYPPRHAKSYLFAIEKLIRKVQDEDVSNLQVIK